MEKEIKVKKKGLVKILVEMFGNKEGSCSTLKIYGNSGSVKDIYLGDRKEWIEGITGLGFCSNRIETIMIDTELDNSILLKITDGKGVFKVITYKFI